VFTIVPYTNWKCVGNTHLECMGERYKGSKSSGSEKMRNTMEKTLRQEDMGGGDLKENVFGTFMYVFFVLPVKIT